MPSIRRAQILTYASRGRTWLVALLAAWPLVTTAQTTPAVSALVAFNGSEVTGTPVRGPDGALYGITSLVNSVTGGLVYRLAADGSSMRTIYSLQITNGYGPGGGLVLGSDDLLYGTTVFGSSTVLTSSGTVFRVATDGTGFTVLRSFAPYTLISVDGASYPTNTDGVAPSSELIEGSDGALYGVTSAGGPNGTGVVFRITRDGTGFAVLHAFGAVVDEEEPPGQSGDNGDPDVPPINDDGIGPTAPLLEGVDGYLYGTTGAGGPNGSGTIFRVRPDGTDFSVVHGFEALVENTDGTFTNTEGATPVTALADGEDGRLYGAASVGGTAGFGTLFALDPVGGVYTVMHQFDGLTGVGPEGELLLGVDGRLYGTTAFGGEVWSTTNSGYGTIFAIARDGTGYTRLHSFDFEDGYRPVGRLLQVDASTFIGIARSGAQCEQGSVFQFSLTGATVDGVTNCGRKKKKNNGGGGTTPALLLLVVLAAALRRTGAA
jgi:uncharacterized repeat protein (TIGR03803 family)